MRNLFLLLGIATAVAKPSLAAPQKPFVDFSTLGQGTIAISGFPALEVLPVENGNTAMIVAREVSLQNDVGFSTSYMSPARKFTSPPHFSFTLYGYHDTPEWKEIKSVDFKFAGQTFSGKPLYALQGPDRDRSQDAKASEYFEMMTINLPPDVARQIVNNKGVLISSKVASLNFQVPASKLDRFKQVVYSVDVFSKRAQASAKTPQRSEKPVALGLPITESFSDRLGHTSLETELVKVSDNFGFQAMAVVAEQGKKLKQPFTAFLVMAVSPAPIWTNVNTVTLSFGAKRLRLTPNVRDSRPGSNGAVVEVMTVRVPYRDFLALAKSGKFYVSVGQGSFAINQMQAAGLRELARRID